LYFSPVIIRVMKSRRMGWAGHVADTGVDDTCVQNFDSIT